MRDPKKDNPEKETRLERNLDGQQERIKRDVDHLALRIGPRNMYYPEALEVAATFIETSLIDAGHVPARQPYETRGKAFVNIAAEIPGSDRSDDIIVVGAHYDTHKDSPGANDNGSAVAALLELARQFAPRKPSRTLRWLCCKNLRGEDLRRRSKIDGGERCAASSNGGTLPAS